MKKLRKHSSPIIENLLADVTPLEKFQAINKLAIAAKIEDLLNERGWNKSELQSRAGKRSLSEITKWLSGTQNLTIDSLSEIAFVFNIPLRELLAPKNVSNETKEIVSNAVPKSNSWAITEKNQSQRVQR